MQAAINPGLEIAGCPVLLQSSLPFGPPKFCGNVHVIFDSSVYDQSPCTRGNEAGMGARADRFWSLENTGRGCDEFKRLMRADPIGDHS
jgi:hypothetical protein